ncbi:pyruvate phosphate dikinase protein [Rhizobium phage RHph_TM16]|nr:pyruvate phosphate dikinase protein [Rhizobium phage RHph_TM16]
MEIYSFGTGQQLVPEDKEIVGGKASSLAFMTNMGLNVPPGFIIPIANCTNYWMPTTKKVKFVEELVKDSIDHLGYLNNHFGYDPLLSVRSGAPVSMPGMMDTILNVGLTTDNIGEWAERIGEWAAWDSYRRLILMLSTTGYGLPEKLMNEPLEHMKEKQGLTDQELSVKEMMIVCESMKENFRLQKGHHFPDNMLDQLHVAINAVFASWNSDRAVVYRKINNLQHVSGTAVTVQSMVFGNMNDQSGTGVLFTRNPLTGEPGMYGEFLINAQGEDVVAGIRTPEPVIDMKLEAYGEVWNDVYDELEDVCKALETKYNDMVDIEFTVQDGKLFILQSRVGKRSAQAAIRIALDMHNEDMLTRGQVFKRVTRNQYKITKRPSVDPAYKGEPDFVGINASPGVAVGYAVYSSQEAVEAAEKGDIVILVTHETTPDDIAGMNAAAGILTATGGSTSHAAVVARAMDKPCVCGVGPGLLPHLGGLDTTVTICGSTGRVWIAEDVPIIEGAGASRKEFLDLVAEDAYQQIDLTQIEEDTLPQNCAVSIANHVMMGVAPGDIALMLVGMQTLGRNIMVDLDQSPITDTAGLRTMFTGSDIMAVEYENALTAIVNQVKHGKLEEHGILFARGTPIVMEAFDKLGFKTVKQAKTLQDLMNGPADVTAHFINNVMGGEQAYQTVVEALKKAGVEIEGAAKDIHPEHVLFTLLAN